MLICYLCAKPMRHLASQRRGAHASCLNLQPMRRTLVVRLQLMTLRLAKPGLARWPHRHATGSGNDPLKYLLGLATRTRRHKLTIVGRCWIDTNLEPATRPVIVSQTKRWSDA